MNARLVCSLALLCPHATAELCAPSGVPEPGAPTRVASGPGGLGSIPETCGASELTLRADAALLIATEDFYGSLEARASLRGRYAFTRDLWLSAWIPGLDYRYVANATVDQSSSDLSAGSLGIHFGIPIGRGGRLAPFVRVLAPTETIFVHATRYGVDQGFSFAWRAGDSVELVGGASFPALFTDAFGSVYTAFEPTFDAEASISAWGRATLLAGAALRFRSGDERGFESFDPKLGVRYLPARRLRLELATSYPLWGADRGDFTGALEVSFVLDRPERP